MKELSKKINSIIDRADDLWRGRGANRYGYNIDIPEKFNKLLYNKFRIIHNFKRGIKMKNNLVTKDYDEAKKDLKDALLNLIKEEQGKNLFINDDNIYDYIHYSRTLYGERFCFLDALEEWERTDLINELLEDTGYRQSEYGEYSIVGSYDYEPNIIFYRDLKYHVNLIGEKSPIELKNNGYEREQACLYHLEHCKHTGVYTGLYEVNERDNSCIEIDTRAELENLDTDIGIFQDRLKNLKDKDILARTLDEDSLLSIEVNIDRDFFISLVIVLAWIALHDSLLTSYCASDEWLELHRSDIEKGINLGLYLEDIEYDYQNLNDCINDINEWIEKYKNWRV